MSKTLKAIMAHWTSTFPPDNNFIQLPFNLEAFCHENDGIVAELPDLRWFRDEINKRVMPGQTDSGDAAYEVVQDLRAQIAEFRRREAVYLEKFKAFDERLDQLKSEMIAVHERYGRGRH